MIYEVTDNRIFLEDYFLEMDINHTIHVYNSNMKKIARIPINKAFSFDEFQEFCENLIINKNIKKYI